MQLKLERFYHRGDDLSRGGDVLGDAELFDHQHLMAVLVGVIAHGAEDEQFKAELLRQRNIYRQLNQEAHAAIDACGGSAQGQSAMAKLNTKVSIGMKTITDKSTRNLAEMLTQGSGMGVVDCIKSQKDYPDAAPGSKRLMQKLQDFEEDNRLKLEQYL